MKNYFLTVVLTLAFFTAISQTAYYVDGASGNDANAGTSLAAAWKTIQQAFDNATPGSTVYIRKGTYRSQLYLNVSGTAGNPIEFRNYQNETVLIDGGFLNSEDGPLIDIENQSNLILRNMIIQNLVGQDAVGIE